MATHEEQIALTAELKELTNEFCGLDALIGVALQEQDHAKIRKLFLEKLAVKEKMDMVRDKLLKEDNDMKH